MTNDVSATHDFVALTASLKNRIESNSRPAGEQSGTSVVEIPHELQQDLLEGLERLMLEAEKIDTSANPRSPQDDRNEAQLSEHLAAALDQAMARWQAQLTCSFEQTAARELGEQLALASRLASDLERQTAHLDAQRQTLEGDVAQTLELKARLARQRKTLAQQFRAERAELTELAAARDSTTKLKLENQQQEHENLTKQIESLQQEHADYEKQIESLRQELAAAQQLLSSAEQVQSAEGDTSDRVAELEAELAQRHEQLRAAREQLQTTEETLAEVQLRPATEISDEAEIEALEKQLYDQQMELLDLRSQNSDLAAQVAKYQVTASGNDSQSSPNQESLSWEERKKLIMQQLDSYDAEGEEQGMKGLEIENILNTTQSEIDRRDREIDQLQALLEQQSNAHEGVAIGAAAIAQMLDSDELINQERQKLKSIQREWEDKLRQAEIDLSMERAKLARERTQLETRLEQARTAPVDTTVEIEGQTKAQARTRKWLEHLGLKEGKNQE